MTKVGQVTTYPFTGLEHVLLEVKESVNNGRRVDGYGEEVRERLLRPSGVDQEGEASPC